MVKVEKMIDSGEGNIDGEGYYGDGTGDNG